ncbi:hypothetical protein LAZ67_12001698 [Cordylochernes scorpioides]|uniref:Reverse transcriptase domain-containing protein n=1 Tax=Cordylochernes scorpioides TaxID=51811 RepID=A0ABY6L184_9ARAC|nr:hypothetical protein LAZ67_12001698 [Cordylochernes scorpioides]
MRCSANLRLLEGEDGFKTQDLKETLDLILDRNFGNVDPLFSENEVKLAAFKFGNRKSPGPDRIDNTVVKALKILVGDRSVVFWVISRFVKFFNGFQRRTEAKTSLEDDDVPIDDTTTKPLFTPQEKGRKGKFKIAKHNIHTVPHPPIQLRRYRRSASEYDEIKRQVEDLKKKRLVRDSRSPWAFPVTLVPMADGQKRLCVDYSRLNALTIADKMPLPNIQEVIDRLQKAKYFTSLDITSGYWHVEMAPDSTEKTVFITNEGLYEWLVMPFGLKMPYTVSANHTTNPLSINVQEVHQLS